MAELHLQPGHGQTLEQGLRMSPQLRQSLKILQAPTLELGQLLRQELEQNPVLEVELPTVSLEEAGYEDDRFAEGEGEADPRAAEWLDDLREERILSGKARQQDPEAEQRRQYLFDSQSASETLQQYLLVQLGTIDAAEEVLRCVRLLIELLDDDGRMDEDLEDLALRLRLPYALLVEAREVLHQLDPPGMGARDLRESLMLQGQRAAEPDSLGLTILREHFDLLARNRRQELARLLRVPPDRLARALDWIKTLDPHPTRAWALNRNREVQADAFVHRDAESASGWRVEIPDDGLPKLRLNPWYKDLVGTSDDKTRAWLKDKLRDGSFMIRALAQRQETLRRVVEEILRRQPELPAQGPASLRPMTMAQVAEVLELHETTVSRAVAGKYIETPAGLLELRRLFTTSLGRAEPKGASPNGAITAGEELSADGVSSETARQAIAELVAAEDKHKPLSDNKIGKLLADRGIAIARRTVAKYREQLGIPPSNLRRE